MTSKTAHIIAHSHWDREWYLPYETHRLKLVRLMEDLIETFERDPDFASFHLDGQYIVLEDYLEMMPHRAGKIRSLVEQGKLILGPWYILQDEFLVSSEANARNLLIGILASKNMGGYAKIGYFPDSFGNMGQAPQLISQAGIDVAVYGRGVKPVGFNNEIQSGNAHTSQYSEMYWESPDGTRVLAILFANWYNNGMEIPVDREAAKTYWKEKLAAAEAFASTPELLFMNGCDHQPLQKDLSAALLAAGEIMPDVTFRHSSFPEYIEALRQAKPDALDVIRGELRSQWTDGWITLVNTASARVYIKQENVKSQTLLEKVAEPLAVMAYLGGGEYPRHELLYAWKTLLQNHPHDSICGCSVDEVHREMMTRFAKSQQVAESIAAQSATAVADEVDTSGFGSQARPFVVFNTSGHLRSGVVRVTVDVERRYFDHQPPHEKYEAFKAEYADFAPDEWAVVDADGNQVEAVIAASGPIFGYDLPDDRFRQPYWVYQVDVELYVRDVPQIGYQTYALVRKDSLLPKTESDPATGNSVTAGENAMENRYVRIEIAQDGSFTLSDKVNGRKYEGLGIYEDTGDIGNEYMYRQPDGETPLTTEGLAADVQLVKHTPFSAVYRIEHVWHLPLGADERLEEEIRSMVPFRYRTSRRVGETGELRIVTELTLGKDSRSVSIRSRIDNTVKDHRIRMLFKTGLQTEHVVADSIYELARRPIQPEVAWINPSNAQHQNAFVSLCDDTAGLTVANQGLNEYEVLPEHNTMAVTLLRGVRELGDWGVFSTPEAQCLGSHVMDMELISHDADIVASGAYVDAYQFPVPWTVRQTGVHHGTLPANHAFLEWEGKRMAFSALKLGEESDDLMLRAFNVSLEPATMAVKPAFAVNDGYESTIMEERGETLEWKDGAGYELKPGPAKIQTLGLRLTSR
ncbi:alpha-mannosidase [Paenibacillus sp. HJL G12]|uniref:Alpha-mannosidase n=1 Tax=Paenibacillus dendrobii TaxID=2691084 RepID=A0A7X3IDV5_9BACL|nr:alpha-mannosidase [Paenibacillus dendrobii]MWV42104.1 alpha-mannosidase [Paenibacillus dendrobii]